MNTIGNTVYEPEEREHLRNIVIEPEEREHLYSLSMNGQVIAENLSIEWAEFFTQGIVHLYTGSIIDITIQRVGKDEK